MLWFSSICWHQVNYRTTTVRQASRRSWRIGQKQPVTVYHLVYAGTVQAAALNLIAKKVHSSNLFDGDLSAGGLDQMVDDETLVALAKQLLDHAPRNAGALEELFGNRVQAVRTEEVFLDDLFSPETASKPSVEVIDPSAAGAARRVVQASFGDPEKLETLARLIEEQDNIRAEHLAKAKRQADKRLQALIGSGQLPLFSDAA